MMPSQEDFYIVKFQLNCTIVLLAVKFVNQISLRQVTNVLCLCSILLFEKVASSLFKEVV